MNPPFCKPLGYQINVSQDVTKGYYGVVKCQRKVGVCLVQQQTWKCDPTAGPCSWICYPCFCPCMRITNRAFICAIHSGVSRGVPKFLETPHAFHFSSTLCTVASSLAAYSIRFCVHCINVVVNTHVCKVYECCMKLLRRTLRMSQGLACERMYIFLLCRRPGNKL